MTINKSVAVAIATGSLLLNAFATTAFADTTVSGNGADSTNTVTTTNNTQTTVQQNNNATITNDVHSSATTGGNDANYNTGGSVSVSTGGATTNTQVANAANLNQANVSCGCTNGGTDVTISGNGADSGNTVTSNNSHSGTELVQNNQANVTNSISSDAKTGGNDANYNTGGTNGMGTVTVQTGSASSTVGVSTMANANVASIGSGTTGTGTGTSAVISGNGAGSANFIGLTNSNATSVWQNNNAHVNNDVWAGAFTGKNDANYNTGGDVTVQTGSAGTAVGVDNKVNFNSASVDCGCFTTGDLLKLAGNGAGSRNTIVDNNGGGLLLFQGGEGGNMATLHNDIAGNSGTGKNDSNDNTGAVLGDPTTVMTGGSTSLTGVSNTGNVNLFGNGLGLGDFNFGFDLGGLFGMFGM